MSLADRIRACDNADLSQFLPLLAGGAPVGRVHRERAAALCALTDAIREGPEGLALLPGTPAGRTEAVAALAGRLEREGLVRRRTGEIYAVAPSFGAAPLLEADRAALPAFGFRAYGVHMVGYVPGPDGPSIWVPRRAGDRAVAPGLLDNTVAGGIASGEGALDTLVRECEEEAGLPPALSRTARPAGALGYLFQEGLEVRDDVLFVYDLEMPADLVPENRDGEVEGFRLVPWREVAETLRGGPSFKFNCGPVLIDFMLRHGLLDPAGEPGCAGLVRGIRRRAAGAPAGGATSAGGRSAGRA